MRDNGPGQVELSLVRRKQAGNATPAHATARAVSAVGVHHPPASSALHTYTDANKRANGCRALYAARRTHTRSNTRHTCMLAVRALCYRRFTSCSTAPQHRLWTQRRSTGLPRQAGGNTANDSMGGGSGGRNGTHQGRTLSRQPPTRHQPPRPSASLPTDAVPPLPATPLPTATWRRTNVYLCRRQDPAGTSRVPRSPLTWSAP